MAYSVVAAYYIYDSKISSNQRYCSIFATAVSYMGNLCGVSYIDDFYSQLTKWGCKKSPDRKKAS